MHLHADGSVAGLIIALVCFFFLISTATFIDAYICTLHSMASDSHNTIIVIIN